MKDRQVFVAGAGRCEAALRRAFPDGDRPAVLRRRGRLEGGAAGRRDGRDPLERLDARMALQEAAGDQLEFGPGDVPLPEQVIAQPVDHFLVEAQALLGEAELRLGAALELGLDPARLGAVSDPPDERGDGEPGEQCRSDEQASVVGQGLEAGHGLRVGDGVAGRLRNFSRSAARLSVRVGATRCHQAVRTRRHRTAPGALRRRRVRAGTAAGSGRSGPPPSVWWRRGRRARPAGRWR